MKVDGFVVDEFGGPLPFVDIFIPDTDYYISTNSDGSFYLETQETYPFLHFKLEGYEELVYEISETNSFNLTIILFEEIVENNGELEELTINSVKTYKRKKENPAYQILREIWKRKKNNGLKKFDNYSYDEYEKIEFDINNLDSTFINNRVFKNLEFVFNNIDTSSVTGKNFLPVFLNESVYEVIGENRPNSNFKRNMVANKTSGFEENEIVTKTVKNLYKDFNIYENRLNFFNKPFISPLARDGFANYEYQILDTIMTNNQRVIKIKYFPKRDNELTFKGTFDVVDSIFMVSSVNLQSTKGINVNFVRDVYAELDYKNINDSVYVPEQSYIMLDMSLLTKKSKEKGVYAHKTNSYKNFEFELPNIKDQLAKKAPSFNEKVFNKSDEYWKEARHISLSENERDIYNLLDTLKNHPKIKKIGKYTQIFGSGEINILNFWRMGNIYSTFGYNPVEGIRVRTGGRTYITKNDMWRFAGYIAYGFKDTRVKYGLELRKMFNSDNRFSLGVGYKKDIEQLGAQLTTQEGILTRSFASSGLFSRGDISTLSKIEKGNAFASIDPVTNLTVRLDGTYQSTASANPQFSIDYVDRYGDIQSTSRNTTFSLSLIAKPGAKYSRFGIDRYEHATLSPILVAKYSKAVRGILHSNFDYDKFELFYYHPKLWGSIGRSDITFEAGKTFGWAPLSFLSVVPGNQSYSIVPSTFAQLNYYEFVTDTYLSLHLDHHFNGRIFSYIPLLKKLNLREVAFFRTVWGEISNKNKSINRSSITYKAPDNEMYMEYGFGIENIGVGNLRFFRVDFNWRGNYTYLPDISKFGVKFGFDLTF